jgi:hypothetical protein
VFLFKATAEFRPSSFVFSITIKPTLQAQLGTAMGRPEGQMGQFLM